VECDPPSLPFSKPSPTLIVMTVRPSYREAPVWLITGSSKGLGLALAQAVLASNQRLVATLRQPSALSHLSSSYPSDQLLVVELDVVNNKQIDEAFDTVKAHFGRIDVVVNNAGYGILGEVEAVPEEEARKMMDVLFWGAVNVSKKAVQFFRDVNPKGEGGLLINVSSMAGYSAYAGLAHYSAAKFALEGFTEGLRKEMLPAWNIRVTVAEPGGYPTEWGKSSMSNFPPPPEYAAPDSPSSIVRYLACNVAIGDVDKAAQAMLAIAEEPNPPLRIQLGSDAYNVMLKKATKTLEDGKKWEGLSHSTNQEGHTPESVAETYKDLDI